MTITFELPIEIEQNLRREFNNLDQAAKEAAIIELYRQEKLTHHELATALGLSRFDADALLKCHGVTYTISADDIARESASLRPSSNT